MRKIAVSLLAAALALGTAAAAQQTSAPPPEERPPERLKAARLLFGAAGVTNGFYCVYGYALSTCSSVYQYKQVPLFFGGEVEVGGRGLGIAVGVHDLNGPYLDVNRNFVEPIADLVLRIGSYSSGAALRFRIGAGLYVGESWKVGFVGRGGIGFTLRGSSPLGLAVDLSWEGGGFDGNSISVLKAGIGPEIAF
jgi:hypothetical protein